MAANRCDEGIVANGQRGSLAYMDHLQLIGRSIHELYRRLGPVQVRSFAIDFVLGGSAEEIRCDPIIGTQHLARRIAAHYRLPFTTAIVTFSSSLRPPGQVELSLASEFWVELQSRYKGDPKATAAILAHEAAHIFLHRRGIRFQNKFENEVLTDTTAAYLGFGTTILNAATTEPTTCQPNHTDDWNTYFGYIKLDEFGYIQAKRDALHGHHSRHLVDPGLPQSEFTCGQCQLSTELQERPYAAFSMTDVERVPSVIERLRNRFFPQPVEPCQQQASDLIFACICCSQKLRVPLIGKKLMVRCPTCESRHMCYT